MSACRRWIRKPCGRALALGRLPAKHRRLEQTRAILSNPEDRFLLPIRTASGRGTRRVSLPTEQASPRPEASIFLPRKEGGPRRHDGSSLPSALPRQDRPRWQSPDSSWRKLTGDSAPLLPVRKNDSDELRTDHETQHRLGLP